MSPKFDPILGKLRSSDEQPALSGSDIENVPAGNISAVTVQAAINELDTEKASIDYVDQSVLGLLDDRGNYTPSS